MKYYPELHNSNRKIYYAKVALSAAEEEKEFLKLRETRLQNQYYSELSTKDNLNNQSIRLSKGILEGKILLQEKTEEKRKQELTLEQSEADINSDGNRINYLNVKSAQSHLLMQQLADTRKFHEKVTSYASMTFNNSIGMDLSVIKQEESDIIGQILADSDY